MSHFNCNDLLYFNMKKIHLLKFLRDKMLKSQLFTEQNGEFVFHSDMPQELINSNSVFTSLSTTNEGHIPFWDEHLKRLRASWDYLYDNLSLPNITRPNIESGRKYIRLTLFCYNAKPALHIIEKHSVEKIEEFVSIKSLEKKEQRSIPPYVKMGDYSAEFSLKKKVREEGFNDVLYTDSSHVLLEATTSNLFMIKDKSVFTPPASEEILCGITRLMLIKCLKVQKKDVFEKDIFLSEVDSNCELFLTNAVRGIIAVKRLNDIQLKCDRTLEIKNIFEQFK